MKRLLTLLLACLPAIPCQGAEDVNQSPPVDSLDRIILASTRGYPCRVGMTLNLNTFFTTELSVDGAVTASRLPPDPAGELPTTLVWVHGNQIPPGEAIRRGLIVYQRLRQHRSSPDPLQFVIWSWPSERTTTRLKDVKEKAIRTDVESFLLASYLSQCVDAGRVRLLGYSFGARIISGALHLSAGGTLRGHYLPAPVSPRSPYRVAFFAAALANDAALRGGRNQHALDDVESLLLHNNSKDQALNFYWITDLQTKPRALGDTGLRCSPPHCQVQQCDWARAIGKEHSLMEYVNRPAIMRSATQHLMR